MSVNESEERLLNSTKKTFLSMWSHSNIFYKKGKKRKGKERKGKERKGILRCNGRLWQ